MKVYVTQGHENGIGLEVFFKSCLMLPVQTLKLIKLLAFKNSVEQTLKTLKLPYAMDDQSVTIAGTVIDVKWLSEVHFSESFTSLEQGMKLCENDGILFTLPTSKDQFPVHPGHTEFFRAFYQCPDLGMFFSGPGLNVLLLSDHTAVSALPDVMTEELIYQRLKLALDTLEKWKWPTNKILVAGLNPHAGEQGLIGTEDERVTKAIKRLCRHTNLSMAGPFPGDTMLFEQRSPDDILVYLFHDQGLGVFKSLNGFIGSNITLGLPYPRFSPDHGTSFGLYGKNQADYRGCEFSLKEAVSMLKKVSHGKNTGHKS